jgi:hypothetical protein
MEVYYASCDSPTRTALPPAASIFCLADSEKLVGSDGQRASEITRAQNLEARLQPLHRTELLQAYRSRSYRPALVQPVEVDDSVFLAEDVGESALRQAAMHRHLAAFEAAHFRVARNRLAPL